MFHINLQLHEKRDGRGRGGSEVVRVGQRDLDPLPLND